MELIVPLVIVVLVYLLVEQVRDHSAAGRVTDAPPTPVARVTRRDLRDFSRSPADSPEPDRSPPPPPPIHISPIRFLESLNPASDTVVARRSVPPRPDSRATPVDSGKAAGSDAVPTERVSIRITVDDLVQPHRDDPKVTGDSCWVRPGEAVTVHGRTITRGMVYVGRGLRDGQRWRTERALIDPSLPAHEAAPGTPLSYYASYEYLHPQQRGYYLDWLAAGARAPQMDISYVFLYFYGLERRCFFDDAPESDRGAVIEEVRRLRSIYGANNSFERYAGTFLSVAAAQTPGQRLYESEPDLQRNWGLDLRLQVALGQAAVDQVPIPADWALQWLYQDPEFSPRTPLRRCREEIHQHFRQLYAELFGEGMLIEPTKRRLRVQYVAASSGFRADVEVGDLPDITALRRPLNQLRPLLEQSQDALDGFSRFIGRHPDKRISREAIGHLPPSLARSRASELDDPFVAWVTAQLNDGQQFIVDGKDLVQRWLGNTSRLTKVGALRKSDAVSMARFLDLLGVGIEPDVRRGGISSRLDRCNVLFRLAEAEPETHEASESFYAADIVITLLVAVANADDEITEAERVRMVSYVREGLGLHANEIPRMEARLAYLLHNGPSLRGIEHAVTDRLTPEGRRLAADLALLTAVADGYFDPAEGRVLEKIYVLLGFDPGAIYSDLHALKVTADQTIGIGLPTRRSAAATSSAQTGRAEVDGPAGWVELDMERVRAKLDDTKRASTMLAAVFVSEDEQVSTTATGGEGDPMTESFTGLDASHAALLADLVAQAEWPRSSYEQAAEQHGLMPGGALETINEWAFEHLDEPLLEDGDPLLVYLDIWEDYCSDV